MSLPTTASHLVDQRLARLRRLLPELGVDALLVSQPENRAYLSGFTGSAGVLLITGQHARPTDAPLLPGEPVVIDIGAEVDGYRGDLTRTVCFGPPNDPVRFWEVYNAVLRAQATAEAGIRPGLPGPEADALARGVIDEAGYGDAFGHGLGHGVGLEIHEMPMLSRTSTTIVQSGMVTTIEPGIYLPDWGGVRIEDIVLITEDGAEVLTRAPKDPIL
jgi:Xaa-Pro aminopeptidase